MSKKTRNHKGQLTTLSSEAPSPVPEAKSVEVSDPAQAARMVAGMVLSEAVNLGEINPAMARRFGERMDQIFNGLMHGAQVAWDHKGALALRWPDEPVQALRQPKVQSSSERLRALLNNAAVPPVAIPEEPDDTEGGNGV